MHAVFLVATNVVEPGVFTGFHFKNLPDQLPDPALQALGHEGYPTMDLSGIVPRAVDQAWIRISI